jgi:hypothetical protein
MGYTSISDLGLGIYVHHARLVGFLSHSIVTSRVTAVGYCHRVVIATIDIQ